MALGTLYYGLLNISQNCIIFRLYKIISMILQVLSEKLSLISVPFIYEDIFAY